MNQSQSEADLEAACNLRHQPPNTFYGTPIKPEKTSHPGAIPVVGLRWEALSSCTTDLWIEEPAAEARTEAFGMV